MGKLPHGAVAAGNPWYARISWLSGLLILAAVVLVATRFTEIEHFVEIARAAQPAWLLAAAMLQATTYLCAAGVWHVTLRRAGITQRYWSIVPLGLAKLFADQVLPTGGIGCWPMAGYEPSTCVTALAARSAWPSVFSCTRPVTQPTQIISFVLTS